MKTVYSVDIYQLKNIASVDKHDLMAVKYRGEPLSIENKFLSVISVDHWSEETAKAFIAKMGWCERQLHECMMLVRALTVSLAASAIVPLLAQCILNGKQEGSAGFVALLDTCYAMLVSFSTLAATVTTVDRMMLWLTFLGQQADTRKTLRYWNTLNISPDDRHLREDPYDIDESTMWQYGVRAGFLQFMAGQVAPKNELLSLALGLAGAYMFRLAVNDQRVELREKFPQFVAQEMNKMIAKPDQYSQRERPSHITLLDDKNLVAALSKVSVDDLKIGESLSAIHQLNRRRSVSRAAAG